MSGVQSLSLNNLNINIKNALIIGIIIAKNSPRTFSSKKKSGESRGVISFTLRDSQIDTINLDTWGSESFILDFYQRFRVGDVVEISSPKIRVKTVDNEIYRPQVTSPFCLSLNEGQSYVSIFNGDTHGMYMPLLHIPTKPCAAHSGLSEVLKFKEQSSNIYVDLLVVVKSINPVKTIKTKAGADMTVRSVEIVDNTTPASITLDMFDIDTIQRAEQWQPLDSVLFVADTRLSWRALTVHVQTGSRTVITHQPHTPEAEALRLYVRNQGQTHGGEMAAWSAWSDEPATPASVSQIQCKLLSGEPFCAALNALLTYLDLDDLFTKDGNPEDVKVGFTDHTGELSARLPIYVLEEAFGYKVQHLKAMPSNDRDAARWKYFLEYCSVKLVVRAPRLVVLTLRHATPEDPVPLY